jgi:hypothetical protein
MAAASWTPNSTIHVNDGTAEYDLPYINNDAFGSDYRAFVGASSNEQTDILVRHQTLASKQGYLQNDRHNMTFTRLVPGATLSDPWSQFQCSVSFVTPRLGSQTVAAQHLNALAALLSVSTVRTQLLGWRT